MVTKAKKAKLVLLAGNRVANACKVALEHDIDVLWIGARTTVNPFAVQKLQMLYKIQRK
jgi:chorismate mutase